MQCPCGRKEVVVTKVEVTIATALGRFDPANDDVAFVPKLMWRGRIWSGRQKDALAWTLGNTTCRSNRELTSKVGINLNSYKNDRDVPSFDITLISQITLIRHRRFQDSRLHYLHVLYRECGGVAGAGNGCNSTPSLPALVPRLSTSHFAYKKFFARAQSSSPTHHLTSRQIYRSR